MAHCAFIQNRLGRTDGVSLEVDKWRDVLRERLGHQVTYCSGNPEIKSNYVIDELYGQHPVTWKILRNATVKLTDYSSEAELEEEIYRHAGVIEWKLLRFIEEKKVDLLLPNNLCSVGYQPASGIAMHRVLHKTGLPAIVHSHDFYFEDSGEVNPTCHTVESIFHCYLPPKLPRAHHVVINRIAQEQIKQRKNIDATVVPNVFDFDQPAWKADDYNRDFRAAFGIGDDDLVFLQATRILDRKGVELAIDVVAELSHNSGLRKSLAGTRTAAGGRFSTSGRIILLCAGIVETMGISGTYWSALQEKARSMGVEMIHVGDRVKHSREKLTDGSKVYSLWDSYVLADFVTYPSTWEGWGNQFIEAVFARLPVLLWEYPVWRTDLGPTGFEVVSLGQELAGKDASGLVSVAPQRVKAAAAEVAALLGDPQRRAAMAEKNFAIAREHFSLDTLEKIIRGLLAKALP